MEYTQLENDEQNFKVNDLNTASWVFKKIKQLDDKQKEINNFAMGEIEKIKQWQEKESKSLEESLEFFRFKLQEYYREQKELDNKFKLTSPWGSLSVRKTTNYNYDTDIVIEYLKSNHSTALRIKEEIDKNEFKKLYKDGIDHETGEVIPGVEIEIKENYSIKTI